MRACGQAAASFKQMTAEQLVAHLQALCAANRFCAVTDWNRTRHVCVHTIDGVSDIEVDDSQLALQASADALLTLYPRASLFIVQGDADRLNAVLLLQRILGCAWFKNDDDNNGPCFEIQFGASRIRCTSSRLATAIQFTVALAEAFVCTPHVREGPE